MKYIILVLLTSCGPSEYQKNIDFVNEAKKYCKCLNSEILYADPKSGIVYCKNGQREYSLSLDFKAGDCK